MTLGMNGLKDDEEYISGLILVSLTLWLSSNLVLSSSGLEHIIT